MITEILDLILLLGLPAIYAGIASPFAWRHLAKPWLFVVFGVAVLYILYFATFYFAAPSSVVSVDVIVPTNQSQSGSSGHTSLSGPTEFPLISMYLKPIIIFMIAAIPTLWLVAKCLRR